MEFTYLQLDKLSVPPKGRLRVTLKMKTMVQNWVCWKNFDGECYTKYVIHVHVM